MVKNTHRNCLYLAEVSHEYTSGIITDSYMCATLIGKVLEQVFECACSVFRQCMYYYSGYSTTDTCQNWLISLLCI
jgi:hypothetical protein